MDFLPLETLQRIFELACTDGGRTGNALSLTSKGIRAAARTARFNSIILVAAPRRLESFVALYERECNPELGDKPRMRHLHLTFFPTHPASLQAVEPRPPSPPPSSGSSSSPRSRRPDTPPSDAAAKLESSDGPQAFGKDPFFWRNPAPPAPKPSAAYLAAAWTLGRLVSPDLHSLVIQTEFSYRGKREIPFFEEPLPCLRELTLVDVAHPEGLWKDSTSSAPLFPALTHLHIVSWYSSDDLALPLLSAQAPGLTHLRVTGISDSSAHTNQLAEAVGVDLQAEYDPPVFTSVPGSFSPPTPPPPPPPRTCPTVRVLVMQPCPEPSAEYCGNPLLEHGEMVDDLALIERECEGTGVRAVLLLSMSEEGVEYDELVRVEWAEGIEGGKGCWGVLDDWKDFS